VNFFSFYFFILFNFFCYFKFRRCLKSWGNTKRNPLQTKPSLTFSQVATNNTRKYTKETKPVTHTTVAITISLFATLVFNVKNHTIFFWSSLTFSHVMYIFYPHKNLCFLVWDVICLYLNLNKNLCFLIWNYCFNEFFFGWVV
jgi:hypothetical protein